MMSGTETQAALARLVDCSRLVGHAFCETLVGALAKTLSVPTVLIATVDPAAPQIARTVAAWNNGAASDNFTYELAGSPCGNVLRSSEMCIYPTDITLLFPEDQLLIDMQVCGYIGVPLLNDAGQAIGVLAALSDKPIQLEPWMAPIIQIFAGRAAAELEREKSATQSENLGRLLEVSAGEIYLFDSTNYNFTFANQSARDNLGYSMHELQSLTPWDLKPEFSREVFEAFVDPLRSETPEILTFRTHHKRKDGTLYPVEVNLQLLHYSGDRVFYADIEDITPRLAIENNLASAQLRLNRIFTQSSAGIVEAEPDGRMTLVNEAWCKMLGYSKSELLRKTIFEVTHPDSIALTNNAITKLLDGASAITIEKTYVRKGGGTLNARSNVSAIRSDGGDLLGICAVVTDISDRIATEYRLRMSETRSRNIIDRSMAIICVLDPEYTIMEVNAAAKATIDLETNEMIGKKLWDCYWWSHDPKARSRLKAALKHASSGETVRYDDVIRVKDDERMNIDFMLSPSFRADGSVEFLVPTAIDISERKKQELMLTGLMREVNHRSKNLLAVIQAIAGMMPYRSPQEFQQKFSERLRALAACQDLLVHSGWSDISLEALVFSQISHFAELLAHRISIQGPYVAVSASSAQPLGMAIYELATNAVKYGSLSNDDGTVLISWSIDSAAQEGPRLKFIWDERGGPKVTEPDESGFGSTVLSGVVTASFNGQSQSRWEPSGLTWELECAIDALGQE